MTTPRPDALTEDQRFLAEVERDLRERFPLTVAAIERAARERYRHGWCCDFDFDNGTYRTTPECIGRTRDADAVERELAALREALTKHRLMLPPHPHGFYIHSALCSCDGWQWDGPGPDLSPMAEQVWADWSSHLRAALVHTVAACAREGCGHYAHDGMGCVGTVLNDRGDPHACSCPGYLATSPATEAERQGGER